MTCPFLGRQRPDCHAVADEPAAIPRDTVAAYCRAAHEACAAFRFVRATGHGANPADFRAWVLRGVPPGRTEPERDGFAIDGS
ncbi:MAG TPA: hypothetical protein VF875_11745 [Anaeromyxobacter sp.]